jgi:SAM-dependent methyltransferase
MGVGSGSSGEGPRPRGADRLTAGHPSGGLRAAPDPPDAPGSSDQFAGPRSAAFPAEAHLPTDVVAYGPDIAHEDDLRLLGHVEGRRVLELGCGSGHNAVALARQGARVMTVDPSHQRLDRVRAACDRAEVRVEVHQADLASLAFVRADTVDLVVSVYALASAPDLDRVFRQAHRVLRPEAILVFSLPHPAFGLTQGESYFDHDPLPWETDDSRGVEEHRTVGEILTGLARANFRIDAVLEPRPDPGPRGPFWVDAMARAPATLVVRARKEGT